VTIAFYLPGRVPVYGFSLLLGTAASLGLAWMVRNTDSRNLSSLAAALFTLFGAAIGARGGYLAVNWAYYRTQGSQILQLPWGGLSWGGALAGATLALLIAVLILQISPYKLLDQLFPLFVLISMGSWLGCWLDGCAYGQLNNQGITLLARDEWGNLAARFPVQLAGVLLATLTLLAFDLSRRAIRIPGLAGGIWLSVLALQTWWLTGLRVDPAPTWRGVRLDIWAARLYILITAMFLAGLLAAVLRRRISPPTPSPE
jgi:prolipoprotein diacylglyceryltransferase